MEVKKECCKIDAVVTLDSKGQIVLPKDLRERANIKADDKLALIGVTRDNTVCCVIMMKVDLLDETVKCTLGPILADAFENKR
ncbi:MAG: HgcAB-associated protein [Candidatus Bathyarchaeota archaeon]|nr:HgcAB-associated protein [Candidatus Bathyarchaeota archaeon]